MNFHAFKTGKIRGHVFSVLTINVFSFQNNNQTLLKMIKTELSQLFYSYKEEKQGNFSEKKI